MEIQIFIGVHFNQQLKQLSSLHPSHSLSIEQHHNELYLGFFISSNTITMDALEQQKQKLTSQLTKLFLQSKEAVPNFSFFMFPKSIIGNVVYKYIPNPG